MDKILGQSGAIRVLQTALDSGRMHHAWIFHGPSGVGKATTAMRLARVLLCPEAQADLGGHVTACGSCRSCQLIDDPEAAHPDLHVVVKELARYSDDRDVRNRKLMSIPLGVLRQYLIDPANHSAQMNHGKVLIVDEAELISLDGQNTLLKTLEEPPANTYIVLVTSQEDRLLPTIRSRCQRVGFGLLDEVTVRRWLDEYLAGQADMQMPAEQLEWVVRFARGSLGQAKLAIEYRLDRWQQALEPAVKELARGKGAGDMGPTMAKLANDFAEQWVDRHANASKDAANKAAVRHMLGLVGEMCRQRIGELAGKVSLDDAEAADRALHPWLKGIDLAQQADLYLNSNVSPPLLLDNLAIQWAASV